MFFTGYIIRFIATYFLWYVTYAFIAMLAGKRVHLAELTSRDKRGLILIAIIQLYQLPEILFHINPSILFIVLSMTFIIFLKNRLKESWIWILGTQMLYLLMGFPATFSIYFIVSTLGLTDFRWRTVLYHPLQLIVMGDYIGLQAQQKECF